MKLKYYFLIILIFIFSLNVLSHQEPPKTKKEKEEYFGEKELIKINKVKYQNIMICNTEDTCNYEEMWLRSKLIFDREGNLAEQIIYGLEGDIIAKYLFFYDVYKNFISQVSITSKDSVRDKYFYNEDGLVIADSSYKLNGDVISTGVYIYLSSWNVIFLKYEPINVFSYKIYFNYDENQNPVNYVKQDKDNFTLLEIKFSYSNGRRIEKNVYGAGDILKYKFTYDYFEDTGKIKNIRKILFSNISEYSRDYFYLDNKLEYFVREKNKKTGKSFLIINEYEYYE